MKKIGQGWQYTAYDLGNGRVLKKSNPWLFAFFVIFKNCFPFTKNPLGRIPFYIQGCRSKAQHSFDILQSGDMPLWWFANPKRLRGLDYEQDKVIPLSDIFEQKTSEDSKKYVDQFVVFVKTLLRKGVIEKSFNITQNFGLDALDRVVLIDIGELIDDAKRIKEQRTKRAWSAEYVAGQIKSVALRRYFVEQMDKNFA